MNYLIIANGHLNALPHLLPEYDQIVAADGGARSAFRFGLQPDVVIGDLDSVSREEVAGYDRAGITVIRHPADKDETDLELALDYALDHNAARITLLGLFGGRWDMTFANLLLLARPRYSRVRLTILEGSTRMRILRGGEAMTLQGNPGDTVSVLPLVGPLKGVTYQGLRWPLEEETLPFGSTRGVSNALVSNMAIISLREGVALVSLNTEMEDA